MISVHDFLDGEITIPEIVGEVSVNVAGPGEMRRHLNLYPHSARGDGVGIHADEKGQEKHSHRECQARDDMGQLQTAFSVMKQHHCENKKSKKIVARDDKHV